MKFTHSSEKYSTNSGRKLPLIFLIFVLLLLIFSFYFYKIKFIRSGGFFNQSLEVKNSSDDTKKNETDIVRGVITPQTKAWVYDLVTRYFTNGGDIYEVFDYINNHQELAFLKEAEKIRPTVFDLIKNKKLPHTYTDEGMYAYLAYLEILDKTGYKSLAISGTLSHQYAKMAYYKKMIIEDKTKGKSLNYPPYTTKDADLDIQNSLKFIQPSEISLDIILHEATTTDKIVAHNKVIGLVQYASALRYLEIQDAHFTAKYNSKEILIFAQKYALNNVPDSYLFVSLSNASTLLLLPSATNFEIRNALYPFFDIKEDSQKTGIVSKVINSRFEKSGTRFEDLGIYSWRNIKSLAGRVPEFKTWLNLNGWSEIDF